MKTSLNELMQRMSSQAAVSPAAIDDITQKFINTTFMELVEQTDLSYTDYDWIEEFLDLPDESLYDFPFLIVFRIVSSNLEKLAGILERTNSEIDCFVMQCFSNLLIKCYRNHCPVVTDLLDIPCGQFVDHMKSRSYRNGGLAVFTQMDFDALNRETRHLWNWKASNKVETYDLSMYEVICKLNSYLYNNAYQTRANYACKVMRKYLYPVFQSVYPDFFEMDKIFDTYIYPA